MMNARQMKLLQDDSPTRNPFDRTSPKGDAAEPVVRRHASTGSIMRRHATIDASSFARMKQRGGRSPSKTVRIEPARLARTQSSGASSLAAGKLVVSKSEKFEQIEKFEADFLLWSPRKAKRDPAIDESRAVPLARKHRLEMNEVRMILKAFRTARQEGGGVVDRAAFGRMLCQIFRLDSMKESIVSAAFLASGGEKGVTVDALLSWYVQNMFESVTALNANPERTKSEKLIYNLSRHFSVSAVVVDKIKQQFDRFDTDASGEIEFDEFTEMIATMMNVKNSSDLSENRLKKFWQESSGGSGTIDFAAYTEWYLKYFHNPRDDEDFSIGPQRLLGAFYSSYNPTLQRSRTLGGCPSQEDC